MKKPSKKQGEVVESAPPAPKRGRPMKARPKLLEAAIREFAEHGYEGTTTAGVARRARTTQPLVHHHFGSKEELFRAALDALFDELRAAIFQSDEAPGEATEIFRRFVLFNSRRPELMRIWMIESSRPGPHSKYVVDRHIAPITEFLKPILKRAAATGDMPDMEETMLLYAVQGLGSYPFLVSEQVRRISGEDPRAVEFATRYADAALEILRRTPR